MFAPEIIEEMTNTIAKQLEGKLTTHYHPTLSREEAMKMIGCSAAMFNEIKHREDFQFVIVRGFQNRYSTANLLKWINREEGASR